LKKGKDEKSDILPSARPGETGKNFSSDVCLFRWLQIICKKKFPAVQSAFFPKRFSFHSGINLILPDGEHNTGRH
jgi:hypothetical protein